MALSPVTQVSITQDKYSGLSNEKARVNSNSGEARAGDAPHGNVMTDRNELKIICRDKCE